MIKKYQVYIIFALIIAAGFVANTSGLAQKINLNAIKPSGKQAVTDEQQGILAVRNIKPSVVDIIGVSTSTVIYLNQSTPGIQAQPQGDKGSGIIISSDGLIVTNEHGVHDPNFVYTVMLSDGTKYSAKVLGRDVFDDVALLKIDAQNLPTAVLGDSSALETGQSVFAIGNTLGRYQNNVTRGVVSGLGRSVESADGRSRPRMQRLIQTDASISPGNSGGPLINLAGEVVGMNTMIDTEGENLSFAIPVNTIKEVVHQLQTFGKASRPYLGVQFVTLSQTMKLSDSVMINEGAYVSAVVPDSPAQAAGLSSGDVITSINGEKLNQLNEIDTVAAKYSAGQQVLITYNRGGKIFDVPVILGEYK